MDTELDKVDQLMTQAQHRIWGFVIYRSVYEPGSDSTFATFLRHLKELAQDADEFYGNQPIFQKLAWTVFEDCEELENATKDDIRNRFDKWCYSDASQSEQPDSRHPVSQSPMARYQFCVLIDRASLDSFVNSASASLTSSDRTVAFVNIISRSLPREVSEINSEGSGDEDEDVNDGDGEVGQYSPIEGNTEPDVGWCKVRVERIYPSSYIELCRAEHWYNFYIRPPALVGDRDGLGYDGF